MRTILDLPERGFPSMLAVVTTCARVVELADTYV